MRPLSQREIGDDGWNQLHRLAGNGEIGMLLQSFGGYSTPGSLTAGFGDFVGYVGGSTPNGFAGTWQNNGSQGAIGRSYGAYVSVGLIDGDAPTGLGECPLYFSCYTADINFGGQDWSKRAENTGLFLIRDDINEVSEPGTLAL